MACYGCKEMLPKNLHCVCTKCESTSNRERGSSPLGQRLLSRLSFFLRSLQVKARVLEKDWLCPRCFDLSCETCAGCHKPIDKQRERSTLALGKSFHVEHFRCAKCEVAFMGGRHYERNGKAYCKEDFHGDLSDGAPFMPRSILYYCYKFPLRDDGSLTTFSDEEAERGDDIISDRELAKVMYP
ncbi:LIM domain protein, partial [Oesophagostomum dentatum]